MRLGIDIGGTKTAAVAIGADGELSDQVRMPTGYGAEAVVAISRMWPTDDPLPAREVFAAAEAGVVRAVGVRERFLTGVAAAVRLLVLTSDVEDVVIGGGLAALGDPLVSGTRRILNEWAADSAFLASLDLAARVRVIPLGFPAAAVGAALVGEHQWPKS